MAPKRYSDELASSIVDAFAGGLTLEEVCRENKLAQGTLKDWLTKGRADAGSEYAAFATSVDEARAAAQAAEPPMDDVELAIVVSRAARKGSVAAMKLRDEMLERERARDPDSEAEKPADPLAGVTHLRAVRA